MIEIGNLSGKLWHRHFAEDSFPNLKSNINNISVITYSSTCYLCSAYEFILNKISSESKFLTIVFGVSDWDLKNSIDKIIEEINKIHTDSKKYGFNLDVYLHTRCHVKMLSTDDTIYLGSQNIAGTSMPLSELKKKNYKKLLSSHELIIEFHDENQIIAKKILENVIDDKYNCYKVISGGNIVNIDFEKLCYWNDYKSILSHIGLVSQLKKHINDIDVDLDADSLTSEIDESFCSEVMNEIALIYKLKKSIHDRRDSSRVINKIVEFVSWLQNFEFTSATEDKLRAIHLDITELDLLTEMSHEEYDSFSFDLKDLSHDVLLDMSEEVITLIEFSDATTKDDFVGANESDVVSGISSNIGDYELHKYQDNDGNISDESILEAIYNKDISTNEQICAISDKVENLAYGILNIAVKKTIVHYECYLKGLLGVIRSKLEDESAVFERIDLDES